MPTSMPSILPTAQIRRFKPTDDKLVRFVVSKANMESLAIANKRACAHPLTLGIWLGLSGFLIDLMHLWPLKDHGMLGYLRPVPLTAAMAVPIMFLIDWLNRPSFEQHVQAILKGPDLKNILEYYSRTSSSGFWILDYGDQFVGLIALDTYQESSATTPPTTSKSDSSDEARGNRFPGSNAIIRHFYVDETYRSSRIQADLLAHAVRMAFGSDPSLRYIEAPDSSLITYVQSCLRDAGFRLDCITGKIGVCGWKLGQRILERKDWERNAKFE